MSFISIAILIGPLHIFWNKKKPLHIFIQVNHPLQRT